MLVYLQQNWHDLLMLAVVLVTLYASLRFALKQRNYIVGLGWSVPLGFLTAHYTLLALDITPYSSTPALQMSLARPSLFSLFLFISVFLFNGRVNKAIARVHFRLANIWALTLKRLSR